MIEARYKIEVYPIVEKADPKEDDITAYYETDLLNAWVLAVVSIYFSSVSER